jgi:hypothetical protein
MNFFPALSLRVGFFLIVAVVCATVFSCIYLANGQDRKEPWKNILRFSMITAT